MKGDLDDNEDSDIDAHAFQRNKLIVRTNFDEEMDEY